MASFSVSGDEQGAASQLRQDVVQGILDYPALLIRLGNFLPGFLRAPESALDQCQQRFDQRRPIAGAVEQAKCLCAPPR